MNKSDARSSRKCPWAVDLGNMAKQSARRSVRISSPKRKYGEYLTKRVTLECYDAMAESMKIGRPYQKILDPPPANPHVAHSPKE